MGSLPSLSSDPKLPWIVTPTVPSPELSRIAGCNIHLKLDNLQPSGSFKSRGIGHLMIRAAQLGGPQTHFYCSSGGNAGLACAHSAVSLKRRATICLPTTASPLMKAKLLALGSAITVYEHGLNWAQADKFMHEELLDKDPNGVYVPPFDHPLIWEGHSTIIDELREQLDFPIDGIVASVGGGGLVNGLMQGLENYPWSGRKPTVIAVETEGADSLNASVKAGEHVTLEGISSIATSLGAVKCAKRTWEWARDSKHMHSMTVSDADAAISCVRFADDARFLVEVSCGAAIAPVYRGDLRKILGKGLSDEEWSQRNVVVEVCGGSGIALEVLATYREKYGDLATIKTTTAAAILKKL